MPAARIDRRPSIETALSDFARYPLADAARRLFAALGYESKRHLPLSTVAQFRKQFDLQGTLTERERATLEPLTSLHFLFQLTDAELTTQNELFGDSSSVDGSRIHSYLFFAAELAPGPYTRTALASIARTINKPLAMPALVLFRHGDALSLAILHRRINKTDASRDVLEKATLVKDITFADPIRAHLEILNDFAFANLDADYAIHNFVTLHQAWQKRLGTYALNEGFYRELADWYFWARHLIAEGKITPPRHVDTEAEQSLFLIRLLTRLIFCWFLQEKHLIPKELFREHRLAKLLRDFRPESSTFYRAILQNLFFGTLNQPVDDRAFRKRSTTGGRDPNRGSTNLWRHEADFAPGADWPTQIARVPFLNGGLFDCLDDKTGKKPDNFILDGFSDNPDEACHLPNLLFFGESTENLSKEYGEEDKKNARSKHAKVHGLIHILSRYKFTIEENTPLDEEIALDPELLGKVFENLLASYNPETQDTARKQTGSFYTPREVVSFMLDEGLIAHLVPVLGGTEPETRLRALFAAPADHYESPFEDAEATRIIAALDTIKILDPACGSGAYPMGALHRLVDLLRKLDPENTRWVARQRARLVSERQRIDAQPDRELRKELLADHARHEAELAPLFDPAAGSFDRDYARKVFLIQNSIFGVDLQPIAVQITKLRFFIALICDQRVDHSAPNQGVIPLPNLETRIVAANTLLPIEGTADTGANQMDIFESGEVARLRRALREVRDEHFQARSPDRKRRCRERDARLREQLTNHLRDHGLPARDAKLLAQWDPYDQNNYAPFFDPAWMFGEAYTRPAHIATTTTGAMADIVNAVPGQLEITDAPPPTANAADALGFDLVVGNPPYVRQEKIKDQKEALRPHYPETYSGTADLYVYFFERALQLLRPGGLLSYITSNKWYRTGYGENLRRHLAATTSILHAIDFGDAPVFTAIAYPTIVITRRTPPTAKHTFRALNWDPVTPNTEIAQFATFYAAKSSRVAQSSLGADSWRFMPKRGQELLTKLSNAGAPLGEFSKGRFYRGILTGFNDAFVVDRSTRDRLIAEDPKSAELLKPFLRGRDVKRWRIEYEDLWLIFTRRGIDITKYPAVKKHLAAYKKQLEPKPRGWPDDKPWEGRKPGSYEWYHIQDNIAYWEEFSVSKIITPAITDRPNFCPDETGFFSNNKTSIYVVEQPFVISALCNSQIGYYFAKLCYSSKEGGFIDFEPRYSSSFPIAKHTPEQARPIDNLARFISYFANNESETSHPRDPLMRDYYETILNALIYELYLPDELHTAGLHFFDLVKATEIPDVAKLPKTATNRLVRLREHFEEIYAPSHPLRAALQKLRTLDPVRVIEGKS